MPTIHNTLEEAQEWVKTHTDTYEAIAPSGNLDLSHVSVFVTGATSGIGRAIACRLALSGCSRIAISGRDLSKLSSVKDEVLQVAREAGHREPHILDLHVDVTSEQSVAAAAAATEDAFGDSLDAFVANAGYLETWVPVVNTDVPDWWKTWEANIKGTHLCAKYFVPLLRNSHTKTFLALSSVGALCTTPGGSAYETTKFAICRYIEHLDAEEAERGLVSIAVHPGGVRTSLALKLPDYLHDEVLTDTVELSADSIVWLIREKREWLSGRWLSSKWDVSELEARKDEIVQQDLFKFRLQVK